MKLYHDGIRIVSPLKYQEATVGRHSIVVQTLKKGFTIHVVSQRTSVFTGKPAFSFVADSPIRVHKLIAAGGGKNSGTWMSDVPQEIYSNMNGLREAHGRVLIGGLGLGLVPVILASRPNIKEIVVVEREPEVIKLIGRQLPKTPAPIRIVQGNIHEYLDVRQERGFDWFYFDVWASTGEMEWTEHVVPLRRKVGRAFGDSPTYCWMEEEMVGQLRSGISSVFQVSPPDHKADGGLHFKPYAVFGAAFKAHFPRQRFIPHRGPHRDFLSLYLRKPGSMDWESFFGRFWDEYPYGKKKTNMDVCRIDESGGQDHFMKV